MWLKDFLENNFYKRLLTLNNYFKISIKLSVSCTIVYVVIEMDECPPIWIEFNGSKK